MKNVPLISRTTLIVVALISLWSVGSSGQERSVDAKLGATVTGRVVDSQSGAPIEAAVVSLIRGASQAGGAAVDSTRTTEGGKFVFPAVQAGTWTLTAGKEGFETSVSAGKPTIVLVAERQRLSDVVVQLRRFGSISGSIVDEQGEPVALASVRLFLRRSHGRWQTGAFVRTDDRGLFKLSSIAPGEYLVALQSSVSSRPQGQVAQRRAAAEVDLQYGDSVMQASAWLVPPKRSPSGELEVYPTTFFPATTDPSLAQSIVLGVSETRRDVDIQIRPEKSRRVSGLLMSSATEALEGSFIRLLRADGDLIQASGIEVATTFVANGRFTFPAVPPGRYTIRIVKTVSVVSSPVRPPAADVTTGVEVRAMASASAPTPTPTSLYWVSKEILVAQEDIDDLIVDVRSGIRIAGRIEFSDRGTARPKNLNQFPLRFVGNDGREVPYLPVMIKEDLVFETSELQPGKYVLSYTPPAPWRVLSATLGGHDVLDQAFELTEALKDFVVVLTNHTTDVAGTVRNAAAIPQPGVAILAFPTDRRYWPIVNSRRVRSSRTSQAGDFTLSGLAEGPYYLVALDRELPGDWMDPKRLEAMSRVSVQVTVRDGQSVHQDLVVSANPRIVSSATSSVLADPPIEPSGGGPFVLDEVAEIPVAPSNVLSGRVVTNDDRRSAVRRAVVTLTSPSGRTATTTDDFGAFTFRDLSPAYYRLSASKAGYLTTEFGAPASGRPGLSLKVASGESAEPVEIALDRAGAVSGIIRSPSGAPFPGASVIALSRTSSGGSLKLQTTRNADASEVQADGDGMFRLFGLPPGDYLIAVTTGLTTAGIPTRQTTEQDIRNLENNSVASAGPIAPMVTAPAFYPGVRAAADATIVSVSAGEERTGIDVILNYERSFAVKGTVRGDAGSRIQDARITLTPAGLYVPASQFVAGPPGSGDYTSRGGVVDIVPSESGAFSVRGLTPGAYTLVARARVGAEDVWSKEELAITAQDVSASLTLTAGVSLRVRALTIGGRPTGVAQLGSLRLEAVTTAAVSVTSAPVPVRLDAEFRTPGMPPGLYRITAQGIPKPWVLSAILVDDREVEDFVIDASSPSDQVITLVLTNRPPDIHGVFSNADGLPVTDFFVIAFPVDQRYWYSRSRRIAFARPGNDGAFVLSNLPPGDYLLSAASDLQADDWFDLRILQELGNVAVRVTVKKDEQTRQDIRIKR